MAIYDIFGNPIVGFGSTNGEIPDASVTPAKTTFFNEQPAYRRIDLGAMESGLIYGNGSLENHAAYARTKEYVAIDAVEKIYYVSNPSGLVRVVCYDANKACIGEATNTTAYKDGCSYGEIALVGGPKFIKACFSAAATECYLSYNEIPVPYNIDQTDFTCRTGYAERIWAAMAIPNLDAISRFKGKTMIVAGDSITESNQTCNNKPWHTHLASWLGLMVHNDGQGGTGFAKNYYDRGCTIYRVENNWETLYPADPDIILVMGNMNDGTGGGGGYAQLDPTWTFSCLPLGTKDDDATAGTQYGVVRRLLNSLVERYPTAKIGMISSTPRDSDVNHWPDNPRSYGHGWYEAFITAQKYVCEDMGIPFLDLYHENPVLRPYNAENVAAYYWDGTDESLTQDGFTGAVHPNEQGHLEGIARPVLQWMLGWM